MISILRVYWSETNLISLLLSMRFMTQKTLTYETWILIYYKKNNCITDNKIERKFDHKFIFSSIIKNIKNYYLSDLLYSLFKVKTIQIQWIDGTRN
jgi:hypothetical protein